MQRFFFVLSLAACGCATPLAAQQNWVTNGDFSQGLTAWNSGGVGVAPSIETFDVTGLGASQCFGINAGNPLNTPNGPYLLDQTVPVAPVPYELYVDLVCEALSSNADGGTVWAKLDGIEIGRFAYGQVSGGSMLRDVLCVRFTPARGGVFKLELGFERGFAAQQGRTPRMRIDNVGLWLSTGPTLCVRGARRPGLQVNVDLAGSASSAFGVFLAAREFPGLSLPPLRGIWRLDPAVPLFPFRFGVLDGNGRWQAPLTLPADQSLAGVSLFFQALEVQVALTGGFGIHHDYGLQR